MITGYEHETMTVGELVAALANLPPELPVCTEGCDCIGDVLGVHIIPHGDVEYVTLTRGKERNEYL